MRHLLKIGAGLLAASLLFIGIGCEDDDEDAAGLVGIWQSTIAQVEQQTIRFHGNGNLDVVIADYEEQDCMEMAGSYSVDGDSLRIEIEDQSFAMAWTLEGSTLTVVDPDPDEGGTQVFTGSTRCPPVPATALKVG
jgi:uncharacterized protein (TIGR03066 family)